MLEYEGDLDLLKCLSHGIERIGILGLSGGNRGAVGCAMASVLESLDLVRYLKVIAGISTFAGPAAYLACGTLNQGKSCYWEECTTSDFISLSPRRFWRGTTADIGYLVNDVFRREIDVDALRAFGGDVVAGVTDWETNIGELVDVKRAADPFLPLHASMAMPVVYRKPVYVNGRRKYDGVVGIPFPSAQIIKEWNLDGLIVFANCPKNLRASAATRVLRALPAGISGSRRKAVLNRHVLYQEGLEALRASKKGLIFWGSPGIRTLTRDAKVIERCASQAYDDVLELFRHVGI
ncbi:MAG: patatin-like phospholipase family protein [Candidatus Paceibacterota bacterium]